MGDISKIFYSILASVSNINLTPNEPDVYPKDYYHPIRGVPGLVEKPFNAVKKNLPFREDLRQNLEIIRGDLDTHLISNKRFFNAYKGLYMSTYYDNNMIYQLDGNEHVPINKDTRFTNYGTGEFISENMTIKNNGVIKSTYAPNVNKFRLVKI